MKEKINTLLQEAEQFKPETAADLENFRVKMLGKKGSITQLFAEFREMPPEVKKEAGKPLNELKQKVQQLVDEWKEKVSTSASKTPKPDLTRPGTPLTPGSLHPVTITMEIMCGIFEKIGFTRSEGPEIEDDWHNFTALNFPPEHPARDMQDTFFIQKDEEGNDIALRTHTSSVQVRVMENSKPPIRTISPGRVYRNEAISARAHCLFHQVEGLYIDKNVSFADLKTTLLYFAREMYGSETQIRLRPSFFPFTEPSAEMDVSCNICSGKGCNVCKYTGWVEVLGCGMVDPEVLENCGIDSSVYSGFAFGIGVERIAMLRYGIKDLRLFFENDLRFLSQFRSIVPES